MIIQTINKDDEEPPGVGTREQGDNASSSVSEAESKEYRSGEKEDWIREFDAFLTDNLVVDMLIYKSTALSILENIRVEVMLHLYAFVENLIYMHTLVSSFFPDFLLRIVSLIT